MLEQRADHAANSVMRASPTQRDGAAARARPPAADVHGAARALGLGSGHPLPNATRSFFEPRFGRDFGQVRVHHDAVRASTLGARAFSVGHDIVFGAGQYRPETSEGRRLMAHELAHVGQHQDGVTNGRQIQRKVVDDDFHVTCRNARNDAVSELRARETDAISLARRTAARIHAHLILHPVASIAGDTPLLHQFREVLWRRFHLDYNQLSVRAQWLPLIARRFELVADWMTRLNHRYVCGAPGQEPPGECTTRPDEGLAWTAAGINQTRLCDAHWGMGAPDQAATLVHEWLHFGFEFLGDCEQRRNVNNTVCYDVFAQELEGTATPASYATCCGAPAAALPPLATAP